jgi:hypothetical protein
MSESEQRREYHRELQRRQRAETWQSIQHWLAVRRSNGLICCVYCGGTDGPFDCSHNDPSTKSFTISEAIDGKVPGIRRYSFDDILASGELEKCSLRCSGARSQQKCHSKFDGVVFDSDGLSINPLTRYTQYGDRSLVVCQEVNAGRRRRYQTDPVYHGTVVKRNRDRLANPVIRAAKNKAEREALANNPDKKDSQTYTFREPRLSCSRKQI